MTKVTTRISSRKTARFAGNWLAGSAESRSARRRLNAILRLACMVLGLKRRKGLGMMGVAAALVAGGFGLTMDIALAQVQGVSPAIGNVGVPENYIYLPKGFGFRSDYVGSALNFTVLKGATITSSTPVNIDGKPIPLGTPLSADLFFPGAGHGYKYNITKDLTFNGPVVLQKSATALPVYFPAGTVFPFGTTFPLGTPKKADGTDAGISFGVPTKTDVYMGVMPKDGVPSTTVGIDFPATPAAPDTRLKQLAISVDPNSQLALTGDTPGDIALGSNAEARGGASVTGVVKPAIAIGDNAKATGSGSIALGPDSKADKGGSAFGQDTNASGLNSSVLGRAATASGDNSTAIGNQSESKGYNAAAIGPGAKASSSSSTAIGWASSSTPLFMAPRATMWCLRVAILMLLWSSTIWERANRTIKPSM